ncbi:MAG: cytochrome c maturation protein CcmE, partial [Pseudomonadota bacterium]
MTPMRARTRRLYGVSLTTLLVAAAATLAAFALRQHADLFYTPQMLAERGMPEPGQRVRIGGFVEKGS